MYEFRENQINPDALEQDEVWYDKNGKMWYIKDMPFTYVKNTISYLHRVPPQLDAQNSVLMKALRERRDELLHKAMNAPTASAAAS